MAPRLVETHRKYRGRGVQFVSLTAEPESVAQDFVERHEIPWPTAYGMQGTLSLLGALPRSGGMPGNALPVLYVVGPHGWVEWCDNMARFQHEDIDDVIATLEEQIERVLEQQAAGPR